MKSLIGFPANFLLALALALCSTLAAHAGNIYLNLGDIPGESTSKTHKDEIEVLAFNFEITSPAPTGGGGGVGKPILSDISIVKRIDRASPKLAQTLVTGLHLKSAKLSVEGIAVDQSSLDYYTIDLEDVVITSVAVSGNETDPRPTEVIKLNFNKVTWTYTLLDARGVVKETTVGSYNKKTSTTQ